MTAIPNKSLAESEKKLTMLLLEIRGTATAERVKLYVAKMAGGKLLSEYLADASVPVKERSTLAESLVEILLTKEYARLPELPVARKVVPAPFSMAAAERMVAALPDPRLPDVPEDHSPPDLPPPDELRAMIRAEARAQLASVLEMVAKALREAAV